MKDSLKQSGGQASPSPDCSPYLEIWSKPADAKRYKRVEGSRKPMSFFNGSQPKTASEVEKEMNGGLFAHEAEVAFPRMGQHSRLIYKARVFSAAGNQNC